MGHVLYRKYRSRKFDDVVGQQHVTDTLARALDKDLISHAYLFTGPHGVGKTSVARILAYALGGVDYDESKNYVDIIEIDAASNRRIDEVRELRDKINIVPTQLKRKIYIVDEVHMLTREAFNALLKTLEEPPEHAVFILATTEMHKLPSTIISRCQRYTFKPVNDEDMLKLLKDVAKKEDITIDSESLQIIAKHAGGSPRDALSLLDQIGSLADKITAKETRDVLGVSSADTVTALTNLMRGGDIIATINTYRETISAGNDPVILASQIADHIRLNLHKSKTPSQDLGVLEKLLAVSASRAPEAELEIILLSSSVPATTAASDITPTTITAPEKAPEQATEAVASEPAKPAEPKQTKQEPIPKPEASEQEPAPEPEPETESPTTGKALAADDWPEILAQVKAKKNTLYGIMRMAKADIDSGELTLNFGFAFHVKRANDTTNKEFLNSIIKGLGLSCSKIEIVHNTDISKDMPEAEPVKEDPEVEEKPANGDVPADVLNVFEGAEAL